MAAERSVKRAGRSAGRCRGARRRCAVVLALACAAAGALRAQVPQLPDSIMRPQWIEATAERFGGTHTTSLGANYKLETSKTAATLIANLRSTTTLLGTQSTHDQIDARADIEYRLPSSMRLIVITEGLLTNDARRDALIPGINNTAFAFVGTGGRAYDSQGNHIAVAVGGAYNRSLNVTDAGAGVYGEAVGRLDLAGYLLDVDSHVRWYNIAPRSYANVDIGVLVDRQFDEGAALHVNGHYDLVSSDNYSKRPEDQVLRYGGLTYDALQGRNDARLQVNTALSYPVERGLDLDLFVNVANSWVTQLELSDGLPPLPTEPDPFRFERRNLSIDAAAGLRVTLSSLAADIRLEYNTNEERNAVDPNGPVSDFELERKRTTNATYDYVGQQLLLAGSAEYRFTHHDTMFVNGSVGIYRYDTPSAQNFDDRDEQTILAEIRFAHAFSPMLGLEIDGQIFLTHLVYLFGQQSNDNNWSRVFRLAPSVGYRVGNALENQLLAEVVANYTEFDFEGRTQNIRSRSLRELHLRDSVSIGLADSLHLLMLGDLRISERGSFSWSQFAESPLERRRVEGAEAELLTGFTSGLRFGAGGRLWREKNFRVATQSGGLEPYSDRTSFGPTVRFEAQLSAGSEVRLTGWWEHRFEESRLVARVPTLFLTVGTKL